MPGLGGRATVDTRAHHERRRTVAFLWCVGYAACDAFPAALWLHAATRPALSTRYPTATSTMGTTFEQDAGSHDGNGRSSSDERTAEFLGYFSLGLGLAEFVAPTTMARVIGVRYPDAASRTAMRTMGLREIGHGISILRSEHPEKGVWSRVAGDALDLAFLGRTFANRDNARGRTLFATANVLAVAALDVITARRLSRAA